ncbi:MAG: cytidine deaminase [Lachnospiraceae bacterium]
MNELNQTYQRLAQIALSMRAHSYAPYSHFCVGAALLCEDGSIYTGCNIENAAYTPSNCAERTAFFKAVSEGKRDFTAIAIAGGTQNDDELDFCAPCGVCRQVMREFCSDSFEILLVKSQKEYHLFTLKELLPISFGPNQLQF